MSPKRPVLRYHGGKWKLAPWIIGHFPAHRVFVEPFGGGASVLMRKQRTYAEVYNDLDSEIVNLFQVLRDQGLELKEKLSLTPFARDEFLESYVSCADPLEQARRTLVRASMGFGSNAHNQITGFRANSNRSGTTPAHDWMNLPGNIPAVIERLRGVCIENRDARDCMLQHDSPQTLHYVDPPYVHSTRKKGQQKNYRHEMTDDDHTDLCEFLKGLQGMVILSGYPNEIYDPILGWRRIDRNAHADGARDRTECLWISPNADQQMTLMEVA